MKKTELRKIIREEIQRLSEGNPEQGDYVKIYEKERGKKFPYYIMYVDSTHVDVINREPKKDERPSGFVAHVRQLKHRDFYDDMIKWMKTGDKKHIEDKTYRAATEM